MSTDDVQGIFEEIKRLPVPDKLRLAADLLEANRHDLGQRVARLAVDQIDAAIALAKGLRGTP